MNISQAAVHPVEAPPLQTEGAGNLPLPRVRMRDLQGMPGTVGGLALRVAQLLFAVVALTVMATTSDFPSVTAFWMSVKYFVSLSFSFWAYGLLKTSAVVFQDNVSCLIYLVAAAGFQSLWSLVLAILDAYALLVGRRLQNPRVVSLFAVGDGVTSTLTFAAACASAGITVLIGNDLGSCDRNHCTEFETATAMAFLSWFTSLPSFLLNFWSLASR
ncbi:CASP-like protein At2g28370 [Striga asiatica]|uniref:CASP-like protein n=1 Tax=Striga asiatica TaxID=4170 RepID=A0A5A7REG8_STRAF|nr:CASP-like protein At2g28370 [Striga asiatica]